MALPLHCFGRDRPRRTLPLDRIIQDRRDTVTADNNAAGHRDCGRYSWRSRRSRSKWRQRWRHIPPVLGGVLDHTRPYPDAELQYLLSQGSSVALRSCWSKMPPQTMLWQKATTS